MYDRSFYTLPSSFNKVNDDLMESAGGASIKGKVLGSIPAAMSRSIVGASGHLPIKKV